MNETGRKSHNVTCGKGEVQGSQYTIDHIDSTLLARYILTREGLYWDIFRQYKPVWVGM